MSTTFRPYQPEQLLLSPDLREWLPSRHLAVQSARGGEGARRVASGVLGVEHQANEGAGGVLSEPRTRSPFGIGIG